MKNTLLWGIVVLLLTPFVIGAELTQLSVHAPSMQEEDEITLTYTLVDDNAIGNVKTDVYLVGGINHQTNKYIAKNTYTHIQTFTLPQTYETPQVIRVRIQMDDQWAIIKNIEIHPKDNTQTTTQNTLQTETGVAIIVDPVRDTLRGDAIYYRAQIINTQDTQQLVTIGLSDVSDWATYRVDPQPTVQLSPYETHVAYIYLKVDQDAPAGTKYFDVTANYRQTQETAGVRLAVLQQKQSSTLDMLRPYIIGAALILLLVVIVFVLMTYKPKQDDENGGDDDDFITYY
jgi:hypothetical protein